MGTVCTSSFFFFFQAEDGIRDVAVTGVQTCALPIWQDPAAVAALRRALALSPWSPEVRDRLALQLWARGERQESAAELEESMFRFPSLSSHAYLSPPSERDHQGIADDDPSGRLAALDAEMAEAIGRGLERALGSAAGGERTAIVEDLASMLEARGHWREAAAALQAEAGRNAEVSGQLARAARDYLKADDKAAAEQVLRAALERAPERGDLYRTLAVDVYAARGDFPAAESVLQAGGRQAPAMAPGFEGGAAGPAPPATGGVEGGGPAGAPPRASRAPGGVPGGPGARHRAAP